MKKSSFLPSVILACSMVVLQQHIEMVGAQNFCAMTIRTYNVQSQCTSTANSPDAEGTIYADGECRTVETSTSSSSLEYDHLPGNYRAECTGIGLIRFIESGCEFLTCDPSVFDLTGPCSSDSNSRASLYALGDPAPEYDVQGNTCTTLTNTNTGEKVTFVISGDCSAPGCLVDGVPNLVPSPTTSPTKSPRPSPMPSPGPTAAPSPGPTAMPSPGPTAKPSPGPTAMPSPGPTAPPTNAPSPGPTVIPSPGPTGMPSLGPSPMPTVPPTNAPSPRPTVSPSGSPTPRPSASPTNAPSPRPTKFPTKSPTPAPTRFPTRAPTPPPTRPPWIIENAFCFSGQSLVEVEGQGLTRMDALKIGDAVLTADGSFSKVYSFGHKASSFKTSYLQVFAASMEQGHPLEISLEHMIYTFDTAKDALKIVAAGNLQVGDSLLTKEGLPAKVLWIHKVERQGVYSPLTESGNLLVNGVLASSYVSRSWLKDYVSGDTLHAFQHSTTLPVRLFCAVMDCKTETYSETTGFSGWVQFWFDVEQWMLSLPMFLQALFLMLLAVPSTLTVLLGKVLGMPVRSWWLHALLATVGCFVWKPQFNNGSTKNGALIDGKMKVQE